MKYRVTYEYHARIAVLVEAENEEQAEELGMEEASEGIDGAATLYNVTVKEIE